MTARTELLNRLSADSERVRADRRALEILEPLREQVSEAWRQRRGCRATIVCLGRKQYDVFLNYLDASYELQRMPTTFHGLRIVWTGDEDLVAVYEERKGGWF